MEYEKKGLHNWRNLFKVDKKDVFWVGFIFLLLISVWAYREDTRECKEMLANEEFWLCWNVHCAQNWTEGDFQFPFVPSLPQTNTLNVSIYP